MRFFGSIWFVLSVIGLESPMQCAATRFSRHKLRWYDGGVLVLFCGGLGWFFKLCDGPFVAQGK